MNSATQTATDGVVSVYEIRISRESCYGCMVCAHLCPTRAITCEYPPTDVRKGPCIVVDPLLCLGCGVCRDVCDAEAISVEFNPGPAREQTVQFSEMTCQECGSMFVHAGPERRTCPWCQRREGGFLQGTVVSQ